MKNKKKLYATALVYKVPILFSITISPEASAFNDKSSPPVGAIYKFNERRQQHFLHKLIKMGGFNELSSLTMSH